MEGCSTVRSFHLNNAVLQPSMPTLTFPENLMLKYHPLTQQMLATIILVMWKSSWIVHSNESLLHVIVLSVDLVVPWSYRQELKCPLSEEASKRVADAVQAAIKHMESRDGKPPDGSKREQSAHSMLGHMCAQYQHCTISLSYSSLVDDSYRSYVTLLCISNLSRVHLTLARDVCRAWGLAIVGCCTRCGSTQP